MIEVVSFPHPEDDLIAGLDGQRLLGGAVVRVASNHRVGCVEDRTPALRDTSCVGRVGGGGCDSFVDP